MESDGIRNGNDFFGSTIYYPENTTKLLSSIIIIPGFANPQLSIQTWGPFLASHGLVCMTIGTNSIFEEVIERKKALQDALISLKAEHSRIGSPLFNLLDTNLIALGGWSMGGGGAQLAAVEDSSIKAILAFCPWIEPGNVASVLLNQNVPILIFSGQLDVIAPPSSHANAQYNNTPITTPKLKYEVFLGDHTIANTPFGGFGDVGRMGLSWLKKYLVKDSCYCPLLIDVPSSASDYKTNIDCSSEINFINFKKLIRAYPNPVKNYIYLKKPVNGLQYNIKSVSGEKKISGNISGNKISVYKLKKGFYLLDVDGYKLKIIKN